MKDRSHLNWARGANGFALHVGRSHNPVLHVVPDKRWPQMWRIRDRDNSLSDLLNLTRAKDAAQSQALADLGGAQEVGKRHPLRAPMRFSGSALSNTDQHAKRLHDTTVQPQFVTETVVTADEPLAKSDGCGTRSLRTILEHWGRR
jgi:hypothetical protein